MTTIQYTGQLAVVTCWCGIAHAVPEELRDKQERDHRDGRKQTSIYCPLGHSYIISGKGEAAKLREQLEYQRDYAARVSAQRDQAEASARAYKGVATKARKRAGAGVCPCCNRTFKQLARHMKTKHPDFEADPENEPGDAHTSRAPTKRS